MKIFLVVKTLSGKKLGVEKRKKLETILLDGGGDPVEILGAFEKEEQAEKFVERLWWNDKETVRVVKIGTKKKSERGNLESDARFLHQFLTETYHIEPVESFEEGFSSYAKILKKFGGYTEKLEEKLGKYADRYDDEAERFLERFIKDNCA